MKPLIFGAIMGLVMLGMLHEGIMAGDVRIGGASLAFILAHAAVIALLASVALLFPALRQRLLAHRPSLRHVVTMLGGAGLAVAAVHVVVHGGVA